MKVIDANTRIVELPLAKPITTALHDMRSVGCVLLTLRTDDGVEGEAYAFTLNGSRIKAFDEMITGLAEMAIGRDPHDTERLWHDIWREINPTGHKGVTIAALSTIDVACWDIVGRAAGLPLHKLFGACRDSVATYASSGLWLSQSIDELVIEADDFVEQGFRAMKLRIGSPRIADDVERVRAVREAIGADIELLVDANQGLSAKHAIRLARQLEPYELTWFEEPVVTHDRTGSAEVRAATDIAIATGETEYTRYGMKGLLEARAADVLMPDLQRIGGYSEFRKAAALAAAFDTPVSSHFFTEHSLAIAGSTENCISAEHVDWFAGLFNEEMELRAGELVIPDRPGTGFTFRR